MSSKHILQNFLSAKHFPEWKWEFVFEFCSQEEKYIFWACSSSWSLAVAVVVVVVVVVVDMTDVRDKLLTANGKRQIVILSQLLAVRS